MKRGAFLLAMALVAGLAAFAITHHRMASSLPDEMTWLRNEFALSAEQTTAIDKLNAAYEPVCADHCRRIAQARKQLQALQADPQASAAGRAAAEKDWQALCEQCTTATRVHLEAVAAQMSPDQGKRYLDLVGPKLTRRDPGKPFGLK